MHVCNGLIPGTNFDRNCMKIDATKTTFPDT